MTQVALKALDTILNRYPLLPELSSYQKKWSYDYGVVLKGIQLAYKITGEEKYFNYIKDTLDLFVEENGNIIGYDLKKQNLDFINNGKLLFMLYEKTGEEKYKLALDLLFSQLKTQPRTPEGGFWHKAIYPEQMWLDGIYMGDPFYVEYLLTFNKGEGLKDVIKQFQLCYDNTVDEKTGLLYHAFDAKKVQEWADPKTGHAPNFWGRAMGWYMMALVDTMELLENTSEEFKTLSTIFKKLYLALKNVQDKKSHVWYQVLDQGQRHGNYLEASCSSMFVYAFSKALTLNVIPETEKNFILESYTGLLNEFVLYTKEGWVNLIHNCQVAGLGGADKRDGSFVYYVSEPIITNDFKGYGAFLQAALTVENL